MLTNKVFLKAQKTLTSFILLKLDTIKAFDYLDWAFLYVFLKKLNFGPQFINVIKATNAIDTSIVVIQGRATKPFDLKLMLSKARTRARIPSPPVIVLNCNTSIKLHASTHRKRGGNQRCLHSIVRRTCHPRSISSQYKCYH